MSQVFFSYNEPLQTNSSIYFNIAKTDVAPGTVISTATLQETTFTHNGVSMECFFLHMLQTKVIRVAGKYTDTDCDQNAVT